MKAKSLSYYDWFDDVEPQILTNLNEILVGKGWEPVDSLHGGAYKDGKWVSISESKDYRNYWHVYLEIWGENIRNDNYDEVWFPNIDNDEDWDDLCAAAERRSKHHPTTDPKWPIDLVNAVRKMLRDNGRCKDPESQCIVFWYSW